MRRLPRVIIGTPSKDRSERADLRISDSLVPSPQWCADRAGPPRLSSLSDGKFHLDRETHVRPRGLHTHTGHQFGPMIV